MNAPITDTERFENYRELAARSSTPTPPCLGEREAVARTLVDDFEEAVRQEVREARLMCGVGPVPAVDQRKLCRAGLDEHLTTLRTENETLRAERHAAIARAEEDRRIFENLLTYFPDNGCVAHAQTSAAIRALTTTENPHGD